MRSLLFAFLVLTGCGRWGFDDGFAPDAALDTEILPPPPASFAAGTRLRPIVYGGNGARQLSTWFDQELDMECRFELAEDGVQRCMPTRVRRAYQYADAACTIPLLAYREPTNIATCPSATTYASFDVGDGKARGVTLGAPFTGQVYQAGSTGCVMVGGALIDYFSVGATVPAETFAAAHDIEVRHGQLSYQLLESDDGAQQLKRTSFFDHARGEICELTMPSIDRALCLPKRSSASLVYSDAACTQRAATGPAITSDEIYAYDQGLCEDTIRRYKLGAPVENFFYQFREGACMQSALPAGWSTYLVTGELPLEPSATAVLRPPSSTQILGEAHWVFDNGMELPAGLYDTRHDDFCHVIPMMGTFTDVCAPLWTGAWTVYTDAACTAATAVYPECRGKWRSTWYPSASGEVPCDNTFTHYVHRYDTPVPGPFWRLDGETCTAVTEATGVAYRMSGTSAPESEFVTVMRQME